ncbi:LutC/YkgG family protein [Desulfuribacillus alkaliarsenatis]|uniref:LUD domain-containing protein n=1 Tax=Desulfuribacillus alkaliarsenatis TaxID=766136 RepID=A0A1E5G5Z0_9FIRM|nr:lactate utilization protein C [Desulfuribacillus alkaliarsenatis]OEF98184.1 hypothetical protein BHF68_00390 [Desulfuribacillus alkaliarsenatis]
MTTKETFLRHVKERMARMPDTKKAEVFGDIEKIRDNYKLTYVEIADSTDGMIEKFKQELSALNGIVKITNSPDETFQALKQVLETHGSKKIIAWDDSTLNGLPLAQLNQQGYEIMTKPNDTIEYKHFAKDADTGITGVNFAVAETGSIVLKAGVGKERSISLLPNFHIAIVKSNQFVKRTADIFDYLVKNKESLPSSVNFITGPSRSADIEMDLSIGVHGPAQICVIIEK